MILKFKKIFNLIKQFGIIFSIKYCLYKFTKQDKKYIELLCSYLKKEMKPIIDKYNSNKVVKNNIVENIPVWVCWFQGEENMPELCSICYTQLRNMLPENTTLNLITFDNYKEYIEIPDYIIKKVKNGNISYTQFSDIIRWSLLVKWGGFWIDSTVFCSKKISKEFLNSSEFWSVKLDEVYDSNCIGQVISNCMWSGFLLKNLNNNLLTQFVLETTLEYWKNHDTIIDYFIQNLLIKVAYENIPSIKTIIDNIKINNKNVYDLHLVMDKEFNQEEYDNIVKDTTFFKLTWKQDYKKSTDKGKETFYGYISRVVNKEQVI